MDVAVCRQRGSYLGFGNSIGMEKIGRYIEAKKDPKNVVYIAMDQKAWEVVEKIDSCCDGREFFRIAKQSTGEKREVVGVSICLKDKSGAVKVIVNDQKKIWKEHTEKLNCQNEWSDSIHASKVEGAVRRIEVEEVLLAIGHLALEIFKAGGDKYFKCLTNIFKDILFKYELPEEQMSSLLVPIFKGKGDHLNSNSYRGMKLLEHAV